MFQTWFWSCVSRSKPWESRSHVDGAFVSPTMPCRVPYSGWILTEYLFNEWLERLSGIIWANPLFKEQENETQRGEWLANGHNALKIKELWLRPRFPNSCSSALSVKPSEGKQRHWPDIFQIAHGKWSEWQVQPPDVVPRSVQLYLLCNVFAFQTRETSSIR